jgi:hypothetical protein
MPKPKSFHIFFALIAALGIFLLAGVDSNRNKHFDVFDEGAHFDYSLKLSRGELPSWGDAYSQETLRISDCLGSAFKDPAECSIVKRDPSLYPPQGFSYQVQHPPLGYFPYILFINQSGDAWSDLNHVRQWGNAFNLLITAILLVLVFSSLKLEKIPTLIFSLGLILSPVVTHAFATVTNDAFVLPASLLFAYSIIQSVKSDSSQIKLSILSGLVMGMTKGFLPLISLAGVIILELARRNKSNSQGLRSLRNFSKLIKNLRINFLVSFTSFCFYTFYQAVRSSVESKVVLEALLGFSKTSYPRPRTVLNSVLNMLLPYYGNFANGIDTMSLSIMITIFVAFTFGAAYSSQRILARTPKLNDRKNAHSLEEFTNGTLLGTFFLRIYLLSALGIGVGWPLLVFIQGQFDFAAPNRYAIGLLPLILLPISISYKKFKIS